MYHTMTQTGDEQLSFRRPFRQTNHMPSGTQPSSASSSLPYGGGNGGIWGVHNPNNRSLSSRDNGDRSNDPFGRNPTSNTSGWPSSSTSRSPSSSPNRTRVGADSNEMNTMNAQFGQLRTADEPNFSSYVYPSRGNSENLRNSMNNYATRATPSRQSPPFAAAHTSNNSTHSQRARHSYTSSLQGQSANQQTLVQQAMNQQAFGFNNGQGMDEASAQLSNDILSSMSASFQLNPNSQTWNHNGATNHASSSSLGGGNVDLANAGLASHNFAPSNRFASNRTDQGSSPSTYAPYVSSWGSRESTSRTLENDRRLHTQFLSQQYAGYNNHPYPMYTENPVTSTYVNSEAYMPPRVNVAMVQHYQANSFGQGLGNSYRNQSQPSTYKDAWLNHFVNSLKGHDKKQTLSDVFGHVVVASGDQEASRFIQSKLSTAKSDEKERIFDEIGPNMIRLMKDIYGNYVMQKLIEHGSQAQKARVVEAVKGQIADLSKNTYGCRVVQKIVDSCLVDQIAELLQEIQNMDILKSLMQDSNGNHVIQKIVQTMPPHEVRFITVACQKYANQLSVDQHSCRVVQRVLEHADEEDVRKLLAELHLLMDKLITDPWGNYVAGHIIQHRGAADRDPIFELVMSRFLYLCKNKLASHVVEKCIKHGTPEQRTRIRQQLCTVNGTEDTLQQTLSDPYGNYVIASMLNHLEWGGEERNLFKAEVEKKIRVVKESSRPPIASKSLQSVEKILAEDKEREERAATTDRETNSLRVDIDSAGPTPLLTNETNSPQSDSLPSVNAGTIEAPSNNTKNTEGTLRVEDMEA